MYALRKSVGAWSAGTRVDNVEIEGNDILSVTICGVHTEVSMDDVVKRRNMTRMVPAINGRERRRTLRAIKSQLGI